MTYSTATQVKVVLAVIAAVAAFLTILAYGLEAQASQPLNRATVIQTLGSLGFTQGAQQTLGGVSYRLDSVTVGQGRKPGEFNIHFIARPL